MKQNTTDGDHGGIDNQAHLLHGAIDHPTEPLWVLVVDQERACRGVFLVARLEYGPNLARRMAGFKAEQWEDLDVAARRDAYANDSYALVKALEGSDPIGLRFLDEAVDVDLNIA